VFRRAHTLPSPGPGATGPCPLSQFKIHFNILVAIPMVTCYGLDGPVLSPGGGKGFSPFCSPPDSCLGAKARFLSFNRTQSRAVTGLLTGPNTLRRHLHLIGLSDSPLCRRCGAEDETSAHILCGCEALASLRHVYLGCSFVEPEDFKSISLGANWNFSKATGLP
jgi:hypothetical protein